MKKAVYFLLALVFVLSFSYYIIFIKDEKVTDTNLINLERNGNDSLTIGTAESFKYIDKVGSHQINDTTVSLSVYTTTVYNIFAKKTSSINIQIGKKIKYIIFENKIITRASLPSK
ncbi:MAG: hypothetical protein ABI594_06495 [Ginsengibacter sp.]